MRQLVAIGLGLLASAAVMAFLAWRSSRRAALIRATATTTCSAVSREVQPGGETVVELVGRAEPGERGPLKAPFSRQPCVWHRSVLVRRYWESAATSEGGRRRVERDEEVYDHSSEEAFVLRDSSGLVVVEPRGARVDRPQQVRNRFERDRGTLLGWLEDLGLGVLQRGETIGYRQREWVIVPGERLYVLGAAVPGPAAARIVKGRRGELLISTRSEQDLMRRGRWAARGLSAGAVLATLAGAAALAAAFLG